MAVVVTPYKHVVEEMIRCVGVGVDFEDEVGGAKKTGRRI